MNKAQIRRLWELRDKARRKGAVQEIGAHSPEVMAYIEALLKAAPSLLDAAENHLECRG